MYHPCIIDPAMMSSSRLMNSNATTMSPTTDVDFAFAPMQPYQLGAFDAGAMYMPSVERPLLQHHNLSYDDNFDFGVLAGFPSFQDSSLLPPTTSLPLSPPPSMAMSMAMQSLPLLPGVPTAELYPFGSGSSSSSSFLKREDGPAGIVLDAGGRIGLNLGRRTYFSPADVLAVDRLLTRSRLAGGGAGVLGLGLGAAHHLIHQPPRCQAEGCKADLSAAKHYHRRHKVCEYHAKATAVAAGGKQQRFCQQCSRFHVLAEFDDSKRSCRKRLTEHNRRRRKPATAQAAKDSSSPPPPPPKKADTTSITTSYNSDHKCASTAAAKSTAAISLNNGSSGVSCLDMDNGQLASSVAPPALSLAAMPPPPATDKDGGGLDTMLMEQVHGGDNDDDDDDEQHFVTSLVLQAQQHHNGNILSCSSVSDHHQQQNGGGCNGFFEVDFI